jgi:hypothetical protein
VSISPPAKNNKGRTNWQIVPAFAIELKDIDISILYKIKSYFGVGKIQIIKNRGHAVYVVNFIKDLCNVIIPHFEKYPLLTVKRINFLLFK